jgi:uncharacterized protein (DUF488 family)
MRGAPRIHRSNAADGAPHEHHAAGEMSFNLQHWESVMNLFTIGYGGRNRDDLTGSLVARGVRTVADVRLRPDRAAMGMYAKAKTPDKGIEKIFASAGIAYISLLELGNIFMDYGDWRERYRKLLEGAGDLLVARLEALPGPVCILCAEKRANECHRELIAEFMASRGWQIEHIE